MLNASADILLFSRPAIRRRLQLLAHLLFLLQAPPIPQHHLHIPPPRLCSKEALRYRLRAPNIPQRAHSIHHQVRSCLERLAVLPALPLSGHHPPHLLVLLAQSSALSNRQRDEFQVLFADFFQGPEILWL